MQAKSLFAGVVVAVFAGGVSLAEEPVRMAMADKPEAEEKFTPAPKVQDAKLNKHLIDNIDIFGKSDLPAIYILAPDMGELEGMLLVRDFSRDPFFMQNIDREEFEMKMTLREFEEKDKDKEKEAASR